MMRHLSEKILFTLVLTIAIQGCADVLEFDQQESSAQQRHDTTGQEFVDIVAKFELYARQYTGNPDFAVVDVPVNFGDTENDKFVGVCYSSSEGNEIIIDRIWWDKATDPSKESLLFHELGHCVLGRDHNEDMVERNGKSIRVSIMHPKVVPNVDYRTYHSEYLQELFNDDPQALIRRVESPTS